MRGWAFVFLACALAAAILSFAAPAGTMAWIAQGVSFTFFVLFVLGSAMALAQGRSAELASAPEADGGSRRLST